MRKPVYPKYLINGRPCGLWLARKEQASGRVYPYWYAYWFENGHKHSKYLGKDDPRTRYPQIEQQGAL